MVWKSGRGDSIGILTCFKLDISVSNSALEVVKLVKFHSARIHLSSITPDSRDVMELAARCI